MSAQSLAPLPPPDDRVSHYTIILFGLFFSLFAAFGIWAALGELDIVSIANGEVVPSSQVKRIQHLEGGIVSKLLVREGDRVKKDQPLVELASTVRAADLGELRVRTTGRRVEIARLEAEAAGIGKPELDEDLLKDYPDLVREALVLFESRRRNLDISEARQRELVTQRQQDVREFASRIRNQKRSLTLLNEQIKISEGLLKKDLTNRYKHIDLLKEASRLKGSIEQDSVALSRAQSTLTEARGELKSVRSTFDEIVRQELEEARRNLDELSQRLNKFEDSMRRTVLRSPVEGVIKTLYVVTRGGVLRPGDTVLDIVPADDRLIIEAKLPTQDIGFVQPGQSAVIRLASADAMRFDKMLGTVINVSPDALITQEGMPFYKVRIETERDHFRRKDFKYQLFPGMRVVANIRTGTRSVLQFLIDPFFHSLDQAMQER